ncbi:MAG: hypothetical protein K2X90_04320 [Candidatus Babeliaceae bacterium]|nr:hypothetical protein [Candidatus Babeliaceae bacterium]
MNIKKFLLILSLALTVASARAIRIVKIINNSPEAAFFKCVAKKYTIDPGNTKKLLAGIPFCSRQKNLADFIADQPYKADDALEIITLDGVFYIWADERGVIIAKAFERGMSRQEALPTVFLSLSQQDLNRVIGCIVTINNKGSLIMSASQ